ncbi:MAG TPA: hypothetical protein ENI39_02715 [Anaerolineae bacterium]|nr:hypothetical protein [Anaerolineae bacterium]
MLQRVRYLARQSVVYGLGTILAQGITFLLIPLYTQCLPPDAYGILSITSAVGRILLGILSLGLPSAAIRFYFDTSDEQQKRTIIGTVWLTSLLAASGLTVFLLVLGPSFSHLVFPDIPFFPYLALALFIACFQSLGQLPSAFFRAQENAKRFVAFSVGTLLLTTMLSILLVAVFRLGATGALVARLIAYATGTIGATILLLRYATLHFQPPLARAAVLFGMPLVPTTLFGWILRLSDRVIMQLYVDLADIGIYTLGYQLGEAISMLGVAINSAWSPFYYRTFQEHGEEAPVILAPIITYWMMITIALGLAVATLSPEIVRLVAQPGYRDAYLVVPWVATSSVIQVFNWITRQGLMYAKKTYWDPLIYLSGGGVNLGLNLLLLPRMGYIAAAWTTLIGFALMGGVMFVISQRMHPMIYEYKRLGILVIIAVGIFFAGQVLPSSSIWLSIGGKVALLGLYPMLLWMFGFVSDRECKALYSLYARARQNLFLAK